MRFRGDNKNKAKISIGGVKLTGDMISISPEGIKVEVEGMTVTTKTTEAKKDEKPTTDNSNTDTDSVR